MKSQIYIHDLRCHAFHGVLEQERIVGNDYVINLTVDFPIERAAVSDDVADTMNYATAARLVLEIMSKPCRLIETVADGICRAILTNFPAVEAVVVDIEKVSPPMSVDCAGAGVRLRMQRSDVDNLTSPASAARL